jgi:DNA-binding transcriptional ArsR family regulator
MNMCSYKCCNKQSEESERILSQLSLIKLLSDKNRLQILCVLNTDDHPVNDLAEHLEVSQSLVSHHLIALKELSLVEFEKSGRQVTYSLSKKGKKTIRLLNLLSGKEGK